MKPDPFNPPVLTLTTNGNERCRAITSMDVFIGAIVALAAGYLVPLWLFRHLLGFRIGLIAASVVPPITPLTAAMAGYLLGGRGEDLIGTTFGVPIGVTVGAFLGSFTMNCICGLLSALIAKEVRKHRARLTEEKRMGGELF